MPGKANAPAGTGALDSSSIRTDPTDGSGGLTDVGNARRLAQLHGHRIRWVSSWGCWIAWDTTRWIRDPGGVRVVELAKDVPRLLYEEAARAATEDRAKAIGRWAEQSASRSRLEAAVSLARGLPQLLIHHDLLDADPWALGVGNGWLDLRDGSYHPPDPAKLMTMAASVPYEPDAEAPTWRRCLQEWLPDEEDRRYLQRLCGAAMVGQVRDHLLVIHYGVGGNGKSTFVGAVGGVLGDYFTQPHQSLLVVERHEQHPTVLASLFRARLAVAAETAMQSRLNESALKTLTGGDRLRARRLYEDEWTFSPSHSLWLASNHLPHVAGRDSGIWRRIRVMVWPRTFQGGDEDRRLPEKLAEEGPGILRWLVEGVGLWQEIGLGDDTLPRSVLAATAAYRAQEDVVGRWLREAGLALGDDLEIAAAELLASWTTWAQESLGSTRRFNEVAAELLRLGASKTTQTTKDADGKRRRITVWRGLGAADADRATPDTPSAGDFPYEGLLEKSPGTGVPRGGTSLDEDEDDDFQDAIAELKAAGLPDPEWVR